MSSIFSTQNRQTFLRRKYCFLVASALSPPVGRMDPLMGRPPRCSGILFTHLFCYGSGCRCRSRDGSARHGSAWSGTRGLGRAGHGMFQRNTGSGRRRGLTRGALFALFLAFFDLLQLFVDADTLEFHYQVRHAQAPLQFDHRLRLGGELQQNVEAFVALLNAIGQLAYAPLVGFVDVPSLGSDKCGQLFDQMIDFFFRRIRPEYEQLFVDPHSSSFKPGARRLNFAMDFSTPSAMMDSTACDA